GTHVNTAEADSNETGPETDDASYFGEAPGIGVAKRVVGIPVEVFAGTWDVTYEILVRNYGNVALSNIQVTDDLSATFPLPTTYDVQSVSSADFTVNWAGYNGRTNINLLTGVDNLDVGANGTITMLVRVIPTESGPFLNTAIGSGLPPNEPEISDDSQDGVDPDPDENDDPTDNDDPTPLDFGPNLFDPPFGIKLVDPNNLPILRWTMVWINNTNIVAINAAVSDEIPVGTTYVNGSVVCNGASSQTTTTSCEYEAPSMTYPRGRIVWTGSIGPDLGATDAVSANHELYIRFNVQVDPSINVVNNLGTIDSDLNGDGDTEDSGEQIVAIASESWEREIPSEMPATGFAPGQVTILLKQSAAEMYTTLGSLWLEIPKLNVSIPIVGVPVMGDSWDVTWLSNEAGYLNGTAFPTWQGNSVMTAHVYLADGTPGPFVSLRYLAWGDEIIAHAFGQRHVYQVRENKIVKPGDVSAFRHEEKPWLTLITCQRYDEMQGAYLYRVVVRAVLMRVEEDSSASLSHKR
ncbi:MAG: sortase, partial [Anaerolineaceae bacterium]|nr:sortase [Anaerolineaceae bacterium]MBN2678270.1 sortase [Anaerolineaceae bacterium]